MDEELSTSLSDEGSMYSSDKPSMKTTRSRSLSIFEDGKPKHPDDELLYSLTAKEELVYRRSIGEMRWEEEESISDGTGYATTDSSEAEAAALLWERVGMGKKSTIPVISVNDRRISLDHLEPGENDEDDSPDELERKSKYKSIFEDATAEGMVHDDGADPVQAIFDLIDDAKESKREKDFEENKKAEQRAKLWRKRLIVVVLLNFVMKFRRRFVVFCEIIIPVIVCGVVVSGMVWNSDGTMQSLQAKIFDGEANNGVFGKFN